MSPARRIRLARLRRRGATIETGARVRIDGSARIEVAPGAVLQIGAEAEIGPHARVLVRAGRVALGEGAVLRERSTIVALSSISLGAWARLGERATIMDFAPPDGHTEAPLRGEPPAVRAVEIGERARIGPGAVLGAGARVSPDATVAPGAVLPAPPPTVPAQRTGRR